jgi:hypothetical protein
MSAYEGQTIEIPGLVAGVDLSSHQYKVVKQNSTGVVPCAATTDVGIGILIDDPDTVGLPCRVVSHGAVKAVAGVNDLAINEALGWDTSGRVVDHATDNRLTGGRALQASSAVNDLVVILADFPAKRY